MPLKCLRALTYIYDINFCRCFVVYLSTSLLQSSLLQVNQMMNIKNFFIMVALVILPSLALAKSVSHFEGKKFKAEIIYGCEEGNLTCDKVSLKSRSLKDNSSISLKGETINKNCPDVCDFVGYGFTNGKYNYSFYPSLKGESLWDYIITFKGKVIAQDAGVMK